MAFERHVTMEFGLTKFSFHTTFVQLRAQVDHFGREPHVVNAVGAIKVQHVTGKICIHFVLLFIHYTYSLTGPE